MSKTASTVVRQPVVSSVQSPHGGPAPSAGGWREYLAPLASLKLTVVLLALSMVLVFAGTWAQIDEGIWLVQKKYFHAVWTWVDFALFLPRPAPGQRAIPGGFPIPGGYLLGLLLLVNLASAYVIKFRLSWKDLVLLPALAASVALGWVVLASPWFTSMILSALDWGTGSVYYLLGLFLPIVLLPVLLAVIPLHGKRSGVILIHMGVLLLLVGEGITSRMQREWQMVLDEGAVVHHAQDVREVELAVTDPSPADYDEAVLVSQRRLEQGGTVQHESLPFDIRIEDFHPNSQILGPQQAKSVPAAKVRATRGENAGLAVLGIARFTGTEAQNVDLPSTHVTLVGKDGTDHGTYLATTYFDTTEQVKVGDKTYRVQLRFKRDYKPFTMQLLKFSHDRYTGTEMAKNFASRIRLVDPSRNVDREVLIRMNEPLRYNGETFYQSSFKPGDKTSILQVVRNPGWLIPYVACAIGTAGLTIHFGITLANFLRKRAKAPVMPKAGAGGKAAGPVKADAPPRGIAWSSPALLVPTLVVAVLGMYVLSKVRPPSAPSEFDLRSFASLPLSYEGRTLPMDTLARTALKVIAGRETVTIDGKPKPPVEWLLDTMSRPEEARKQKVFRIANKDLLALLQLNEEDRVYSFEAIMARAADLDKEINRALQVDSKSRDVFDRQVLELAQKVNLYMRLAQLQSLFVVPPAKAGEDWKSLGDAMMASQQTGQVDPFAGRLVTTLQHYRERQPSQFNAETAAFGAMLAQQAPVADRKASFETWFNHFDPFTRCMVLYVVVFLLAAGSWIGWGSTLARASLWVLALALVVHTIGLGMRVYISGRPPVTNLASSAIFIAWGAGLLALGIEYVYRNGIGAAGAAVVGFCSLMIAQRLSLSGDTMQVLQAVLDTNFWLWTHVLTVTMGYAATFLAGLVAIVYIVLGMFTRTLRDPGAGKAVARIVYGVICFAILFSFVGTVLGGIWADQSWGRFWGWDPKENGAVLIVLWNAIILHSRWSGLVRDRGLMLLAIFGNVVTSWSWFGTNMLGVGLHSYGFMDSAMFWLVLFVGSQLAFIALGNVPLRWWRSFSAAPTPPSAA